jgi:hypothetical protein
MDSNASRSSGSARNTIRGMALPVDDSVATRRQNDLPRMSNECAVDLVLVNDWSMRTVTSGSARHNARTRSTIFSGTSIGAFASFVDVPPAYGRVSSIRGLGGGHGAG